MLRPGRGSPGRAGGIERTAAAWHREPMPARRDLPLAALVGAWVIIALGLDAHATLTEQRLLGAGTWLLLLVMLRGESRATRLQVGIVVAYATTVEYVFAGWLGVYVYRLHNVPAFVPPGHGLVYLAALALGRSALAHRHARQVITVTVVTCGGWVLWGLALSPRLDVLGALWFGCLLVFLRRGRTPLVYCGAFVATSVLELYGTGLGTWAWQGHDPTGLIPIGNPPSGIAGGYCFFDAAALWLTPRLLARYDARRLRGGLAGMPVAGMPEPATMRWSATGSVGRGKSAAGCRSKRSQHRGMEPAITTHHAATVRSGQPAQVGEATTRLLDDHLQGGKVPQRHLGLAGDVDCPLGDQHV